MVGPTYAYYLGYEDNLWVYGIYGAAVGAVAGFAVHTALNPSRGAIRDIPPRMSGGSGRLLPMSREGLQLMPR